MKVNKQVLESLRRYDRKLYIKWNNVNHVWEIWRKMPWGDKIITPVTENIFQEAADMKFAPLDSRIINWLYLADSQRKDLPLSWRFKKNRIVHLREEKKWKKFRSKLSDAAKDNYNILNEDLIRLQTAPVSTNWKRPEVQSRSKERIMYRKEYYDGN